MNSLEMYEALGVVPTDDYDTLKKAYIVRLKKLNKKLAKVRGTEDQSSVSNDLLNLNQAFNEVNKNKGTLTILKIKAESDKIGMGWEEDDIEEFLETTETSTEPLGAPQTENRTPVTVDVEKLVNSLKVNWEPKASALVEEIITLRDFLNGSSIMMEDGSMIDIPAGFLGIMSKVIDGENPIIQFIRILGKDSVTFTYTPLGDLKLKTVPEGAKLNKHTLSMTVAGIEFNFNLKKLKKVDNSNWIGEGQGILSYGIKEPGNLYLSRESIKRVVNPEVTDELIKYLDGIK